MTITTTSRNDHSNIRHRDGREKKKHSGKLIRKIKSIEESGLVKIVNITRARERLETPITASRVRHQSRVAFNSRFLASSAGLAAAFLPAKRAFTSDNSYGWLGPSLAVTFVVKLRYLCAVHRHEARVPYNAAPFTPLKLMDINFMWSISPFPLPLSLTFRFVISTYVRTYWNVATFLR